MGKFLTETIDVVLFTPRLFDDTIGRECRRHGPSACCFSELVATQAKAGGASGERNMVLGEDAVRGVDVVRPR